MINAAAERGNDPEQMAVPADWLASMFLFWLQI
jgi:hypothetical protein